MSRVTTFGLFRKALLAVTTLGLVLTTGQLIAQTPTGLSPQVTSQITALMADKANWTPAQQKLESSLIYSARSAQGQAIANGFTGPAPAVGLAQIDLAGRVLIEVHGAVNAALLNQITQLGGVVQSSLPQYNTVVTSFPIAAVEILAANANITSIQVSRAPLNNSPVSLGRPAFASRAANVRSALSKALVSKGRSSRNLLPRLGVGLLPGKGTTVSEAVLAHGANIVQNAGVLGTGVKVCVISNGVSTLAARQAAGELPATVLILGTGQGGTSGDEGTAMLELVADMAPGTSLGFSTGNGGEAQMAQNILDLRNVLACDIIVDDLTYFAEGAFQDGVIANAVTTIVAGGGLFFSSSANSGHLSGTQSGTWEGDFSDGGAAPAILADGAGSTVHLFTAGQPFDTLTTAASAITLKWSDPLTASGNDYDFCLTNSTGTTLILCSMSRQVGAQLPFEGIFCSGGATCIPSGTRIYVVNFQGTAATRALRLDTHRARLSIATNGSTFGHNATASAMTVAAVSNAFTPISGRKFLATDTITTYSSDGPRKLFLNPTPATTYITPGCTTYGCAGGGGTLLSKVDMAASDCNVTTTPGFAPFCGTSAAAPQAAAIAALIKSSPMGLTPAQIIARMKATAIDIMVPGVDVDSGSGIVMADAAIMTSVSITSSPSAMAFSVSGVGCAAGAYATPQTLNVVRGASCIFTATSPVAGGPGQRFVFKQWTDGSLTNPRTIAIPDAVASSFNIVFDTQFQLTTAAGAGGTVSPASGNFFNAGTVVPVLATPNAGFAFVNWTGPVASATSASTTVTMDAAKSVTANFAPAAGTPVTVNVPAGISFTLNGVTLTGPRTVNLPAGTYTLSTTSPQALGAGTQAVFASWSDGGAISHTITVNTAPLAITATFTTQFQLTTAAGAGGTVTPASGLFFNAGTVVPVVATPNAGFAFVNWTGPVASAAAASTTVTMDAPKSVTANFTAAVIATSSFQVRYAANLTAGDSLIKITNPGANGASLTGPGFGPGTGNICVNVYAFSPDEQLVSCCSCLITPNGLVSLSINQDLVSNTLTGVRPNSLVVKLVNTAAGPGFTGTNCTNSASVAGGPNFPLADGMQAFGTTLHAGAAAGAFNLTETPFIQATLSAAELASITNRCTNIIGNGSTFGICRSCTTSGFSATK